jgi:hypothetical protein
MTKLRTYEEIIKENPDAVFIIEGNEMVSSDLDEDLELSLDDTETDQLPCLPSTVYLAKPSVIRQEDVYDRLYDILADYYRDSEYEDDPANVMESLLPEQISSIVAALNDGISKHMQLYEHGEQVDVSNLWNKIKVEMEQSND